MAMTTNLDIIRGTYEGRTEQNGRIATMEQVVDSHQVQLAVQGN